MKVAIIIHQVGRGGAERQALNATWELARRGHEVKLIHYRPSANPYDHPAISAGATEFLPKGRSRLAFLWRLRSYLKRGQFDVVHAFKGAENIYGCLAGRLSGAPVVLGGYRVEYTAGGLLRITHRLLRLVVNGWIVNARGIANSMVKALGVSPDEVFILYNGIVPDEFVSSLTPAEAKEKLGLRSDCHVVSKIANLRVQKNHPMFLRMAARVLKQRPQTRFLIVGQGPMQSSIEDQIRSMDLSHAVVVTGPRGDIPDVLAATDVSVLTSHYEGLANALLESMCASVPVVTTDYKGVEEIVTDQQEGFVVPCENDEAMADKVSQLLADPALCKRMGATGRRKVEEQFSMSDMGATLVSIYENQLRAAGETP